MPNLNKVMIMGNLTRDPELRYTNTNMAVVNLGLAVNRRWRNRETNEQQEETTFVDCEAWGRQAEVLNQYLRKGRPVYLEGRLKLDQWQDQSGNNRSKLRVVVENFQFLDSRGDGEQGASGGYSQGNQGNQGGYGPPGGNQGNQGGNQGGYGGPPQGGGYSQAPSGPPAAPPPHAPIDEGEIPF